MISSRSVSSSSTGPAETGPTVSNPSSTTRASIPGNSFPTEPTRRPVSGVLKCVTGLVSVSPYPS